MNLVGVSHFVNESGELFGWLVKPDQQDFTEIFEFGGRFDLMLDHWEAGDWKERFWNIEGERSESGS